MNNEDHGDKPGQVEQHSLPGTNQAGTGGKGSGSCEDNHEDSRPGGAAAQQDQLDEHSLPGTGQAGKGPPSDETNDAE